jgi:hypothetical protein
MDDKKLWKVFSEFIRLRDSNENGFCRCFTCPGIRYYKNMDAGHGIPRGNMATKYNEQNNHAQCKQCNGPAGRGKPKEYKAEMDKRYGPGTWDDMMLKSRTVEKLGSFDIKLMTFHYQTEVDKLKASKNLR